MNSENPRESLGTWLAAALLLAAGIMLQFYHLAEPDFIREAPARHAAYARQMNADNLWLAPVVAGEPRLEASPLLLWTIKLANGLKVEIEPFDVRVPGAVSAMLIILLTAWWFIWHAWRYGRADAAEAAPEGFALLAGLLVAASPFMILAGRSGTAAALFTLLYIGAAGCWGESLEARRSFYAGRPWRSWILWGYLLAGLATLVYGPLALLLLWIPYAMAAHAYRLHGLDWVHGAGLLLALGLGALWPLGVTLAWPDFAGRAWISWISLGLFEGGEPRWSAPGYLGWVLLGSLPWAILAAVMAGRVWLRKDRSPTLVFWTCSLVGNVIVLTIVSPWSGSLILPVIPFVALLSADALFRWNFESAWASVLRVPLRVTIALALAAGLFLAVLTNSDLGQIFLALIAAGWIFWTWLARRQGITYTHWQSSLRLASIALLVIIAGEAAMLGDWVPREQIFRPTLNYFARIDDRLEHLEGSRGYYHGADLPPLYRWHLRETGVPSPAPDVAALQSRLRGPAVVYTRNLSAIPADPSIATLTRNPVPGRDQAMLLVMPSDAAPATRSLRVGLVGNSGTRRHAASQVVYEMDRFAGRIPIDDVILLGNNLYGPNVFDHLDFIESFEGTFRRLMKRGVRFHAALGHEDQSYAWIQARYAPFNMDGRRYYSRTLGSGLLEIFLLDSPAMRDDPAEAERQLEWLDRALAASTAPWKMVGLHSALATAAERRPTADTIADRILGVAARHGVDLVAWGGGYYYERLQRDPAGPMLFNAGWSGDAEDVEFAADPALLGSHDGQTGFILLDVTVDRLAFQAIDRKGRIVDSGELAGDAAGGD